MFLNRNTFAKEKSHAKFKQHGISISVSSDDKLKAIDGYLAKDKGSLEVSMLERDGDNATFSVILESPSMEESIATKIEVQLQNERVIDNPMETVNQSTAFFHESVNDIFNKSRGKYKELKNDSKLDTEKYDFMKMEAFANKIHQRIDKGLTHGFDYSNNLEKEEAKHSRKFSNPKLNESPRVSKSPSLNLSM